MTGPTIRDIPHELLRDVILMLQPRDYGHAMLVCKWFYSCMRITDRTIDRFLTSHAGYSLTGKRITWTEYQGRLHGTCINWHADNVPAFESTYARGKLHGLFRSYGRTGACVDSRTYCRDRLHGYWHVYNETDGALICVYIYDNDVCDPLRLRYASGLELWYQDSGNYFGRHTKFNADGELVSDVIIGTTPDQ